MNEDLQTELSKERLEADQNLIALRNEFDATAKDLKEAPAGRQQPGHQSVSAGKRERKTRTGASRKGTQDGNQFGIFH